MTKTRLMTAAAALAVALPVLPLQAADGTLPEVIARQQLMKDIGGATRVLGRMAQGQDAFDAVAAEAARADLQARAARIAALFQPEVTEPASTALPEVWLAFDEFAAKGTDLEQAVAGLDVTSLETLQAGFGAVGGTCRACHTSFRAPD